MTEKSGGFVQGRYVEDLTAGASIDPSTDGGASGTGTSETPIGEQLGVASASVAKAVDDVVGAVRTLVGTEEGHQYMEAKVNNAGETLSSVLRDLQARVGNSLKKK